MREARWVVDDVAPFRRLKYSRHVRENYYS
jgi:hypothetical protein